MSTVTQNARRLNLPEEKLLGDWIVTIPGFTLEKYRKLQRSRLSIFAINCFGGMLSNTLGLPFRSPFINLWLDALEYIRFLSTPHIYMEKQFLLKKTVWSDILKINYPIVALGDITIYMNHYPSFDEGVTKWNERKQKINWYNIFVMAYTTDEKILEKFDELPHAKKVCFFPFKSDLDSAWYINPEIDKRTPKNFTPKNFGEAILRFAAGTLFYYDVFDMLLYGKKTPLIEM